MIGFSSAVDRDSAPLPAPLALADQRHLVIKADVLLTTLPRETGRRRDQDRRAARDRQASSTRLAGRSWVGVVAEAGRAGSSDEPSGVSRLPPGLHSVWDVRVQRVRASQGPPACGGTLGAREVEKWCGMMTSAERHNRRSQVVRVLSPQVRG